MNLSKIEEVARRAQEQNPGPYRIEWTLGSSRYDNEPGIDYIRDATGDEVCCGDSGVYNPAGATAEHIAQCSPDVILQMVARIRELEQKLEPSRLQELLEMRLLDASDFPYAASKESIAEVVSAIVGWANK